MLCILSETTDTCFNLAADEYFLKNSCRNYLILSVNDRSAVIGKHQVAHMETNTEFVHKNNIPVFRRISGGGAVFHDTGNINYSFILNSEPGHQVDFFKYTLPVMNFLISMGVNAKFEGKNDLRTEGVKISGNAEYIYRNRVLHHGTLLFDANLEMLRGSIREDIGRYETRAVRSNPSSVGNIREYCPQIDNTSEFRSKMLQWFLKNYPGAEIAGVSSTEAEKINDMADKKYRTWEWNYGYGPEYRFTGTFTYKDTASSCSLFVEDGVIRECEMKGPSELQAIARLLCGCRHTVKDISGLFVNRRLKLREFDIFNLF